MPVAERCPNPAVTRAPARTSFLAPMPSPPAPRAAHAFAVAMAVLAVVAVLFAAPRSWAGDGAARPAASRAAAGAHAAEDGPRGCVAAEPSTGRPLSARTIAPAAVALCGTAWVTTTLRAECGPPPLDVAVVVDRSGSMVGQPIEDAKAAARAMVEALGLPSRPPTRAALVSHGDPPTVDSGLTDDPARLRAAIDGLAVADANVADNLPGAIDTAAQVLADGRAGLAERPIGIMIVLSDGGQTYAAPQVTAAARRAGAAGALVVPVCVDNTLADCATMREIATRPEFAYTVAGTAGLDRLFAALAAAARDIVAPELVVEDMLPPGLTAQPAGLLAPTVSADGRRLTWRVPFFPRRGITLTYAIAPQWIARFDLPAPRATLEDALGATVDLGIGASALDVVGDCGLATPPPPTTVPLPTPTATPTPSPGPAATATPRPSPSTLPPPVYLPVAYRDQCLLRDRPVDVVLVVDASLSMADPTAAGRSKLAAAQDGARAFVDRMRPVDRTAILAFNAGVDLRAGLTDDRAALAAAVDGVALAAGTRIDVALYAAAAELAGPRRRAESLGAIVLLTDGRQGETTPAAVLAAADAARGAGAMLFTIGVGGDVDLDLLAAVAGDPARTFAAGDGEALAAIYRGIGERIPCE